MSGGVGPSGAPDRLVVRVVIRLVADWRGGRVPRGPPQRRRARRAVGAHALLDVLLLRAQRTRWVPSGRTNSNQIIILS